MVVRAVELDQLRGDVGNNRTKALRKVARAHARVADTRRDWLHKLSTSVIRDNQAWGVLTTIRSLKDEGMTMLLATHEMGFARRVADRVCFLEKGGILEQGPPQQVPGAPREPRTQQFLQRIIEAGRL